jgi:Antitoxin of toxin-antitoxin, RelE / RelB, TA system
MSAEQTFSTLSFSQAKAGLSDVMSGVVREHRPAVVERHRGKEAMVLLGLSDLQPLLEHFRFTTKVSVSKGEFVLRQPELGLIAGGESFEEAAQELEELAFAYAERFFDRLGFYMQTDRAEHMPWLLRIMLTPSGERGALLTGRFALILRDQLEVSREQFWAAIRSGEPVGRPSSADEPAPVEHEAWVVAVLTQKLHMTAKQIAALSAEEAVARVEEYWSRPKD